MEQQPLASSSTILALKPSSSASSSPTPHKPTKAILRQLYSIISEQSPLIILTSISVILGSIVQGLLPYRFSLLIKDPPNSHPTSLILLILLSSLLMFARRYLMSVTNQVVLLSLRSYCFGQLLNNDMVFFQKNKVGHLLTVFTVDLETIRSMLTKTLFTVLKNLSRLVTTLGLLAYLSPKLTMLLLTLLPFNIYLILHLTRIAKSHSKAYSTSNSSALSFVLEVFRGAQIGKTFSNEREDQRNYDWRAEEMQRINSKKATVAAALAGLGFGMGQLGTLLVVWVGFLVIGGEQGGDGGMQAVAGFLLYIGAWNQVVTRLAKKGLKMTNGLVAVERVLELLRYQPNIPPAQPNCPTLPQTTINSTTTTNSSHPITLHNVSFSYSKKRGPILHNLTLNIHQGQYIGIVGASGCGKSTVLKLLLRLYTPSSGTVRCGFPSQRIGYVPQQAVIFKGTLAANINFGGIDEERMVEICKQVGIWEVVASWPEGLQTRVGGKGVKLSGGQKQRIGLARALSISPELLLLDEATASLDNKAEDLICDTILHIARRRRITIISISHHSRRWTDFDRIVVMSHGRVHASGTPQQLSTNPDYLRLAL